MGFFSVLGVFSGGVAGGIFLVGGWCWDFSHGGVLCWVGRKTERPPFWTTLLRTFDSQPVKLTRCLVSVLCKSLHNLSRCAYESR